MCASAEQSQGSRCLGDLWCGKGWCCDKCRGSTQAGIFVRRCYPQLRSGGALDQNSLSDGFAYDVIDQVPPGCDFTRQIQAIRIDDVDNRGNTKPEKLTRLAHCRQRLNIAAPSARNQVEYREGAVFVGLQLFCTRFGQIPAEVTGQ